MDNALNLKEIRERTQAIIDRLPQRDLIDSADARAWLDEVMHRFPEQAPWHATRAGGFGGSQIGELVRNFHGVRGDHSSAHDIVESSLLRRTPDAPTSDMLRGVGVEEWHRQWFMQKYMAQRDDAGFRLLSKSTGPREWMRYSPDELCFMPQGTFDVQRELRPGEDPRPRVLGDYKAPSQVSDRDLISYQYKCQLHMGKLVLEHNGLNVDGMILSQFDWKGWRLKDDVVYHDPDMDQHIMQAGDHYWFECVMKGRVPEYVRKERLDEGLDAALKERFANASFAFSRLKAFSGVLEEEASKIMSDMKESLGDFQFGSAKLMLDGVSVSASPVFDEDKVRDLLPEAVFNQIPLKGNTTRRYDQDAMVKALRDLGVDTKEFLLPKNLDGNALYETLLENGVDADGVMTESLRFLVNKQVTEQARDFIGQQYASLINYQELGGAGQQEDAADAEADMDVAVERPSA